MFPSRSTTVRYVVSFPVAISPAPTSHAALSGSINFARSAAHSFETSVFTGIFCPRGSARYFATSAYASFFASIIACSVFVVPNPYPASLSPSGNVSMMFNISSAPIPCPFGGKLRQVLRRHCPVVPLFRVQNLLRDFAFVECIASVLGNFRKRLCKLGIFENIADFRRPVIRQVQRRGRIVCPQ